jgi:NAD(P)-dependent dehydrogenase (short-subunit alcohol dehydrogenase family)
MRAFSEDLLRGKRILITGGGTGLGKAMGRRFVELGANLAICGRRREVLATTASEFKDELGASVQTIGCDVRSPEQVESMLDAAWTQGPLDVLVNNAAAAIYQPLTDFPLKRRRLVFEVNVHAPLDLAQAVIPGMVERGAGWIVNLSSGSAKNRPGPPFAENVMGSTLAVYGASKAALNRLTNGLAEELIGTGVRVNTVEPRAAVHSEGADAHLGDALDAALYESMEDMVEGALVLCDCPPEVTGGVHVSLDLLGRAT